MRRLILAFSLIIFFLFFTDPVNAVEKLNLDLTGSLLPNQVGNTSIVSLGLGYMKPEQFNQIKKIKVVVDPFVWNEASHKYEPTAITNKTNAYMVVMDPKELPSSSIFLTEGVEYQKQLLDSVKSSGTGEVKPTAWLFDVLDLKQLNENRYLNFYFEDFFLQKTGEIHIDVSFYDERDDYSKPLGETYIDLPIVEAKMTTPLASVIPIQQETPTPSQIPGQINTKNENMEETVRQLEKKVERLKEEQESVTKRVEKQESLLQKIISFLKRLFGKGSVENL